MMSFIDFAELENGGIKCHNFGTAECLWHPV